MKLRLCILSVFLALGATSALADPIVLTFTGLQNGESINNYYNGGSGSLGSTGGPNYGISFTPDSLAIISQAAGGSGNFNNVPPPATNTIAFFLSGAGDTMNVAGGFNTGFAFYYSAPYYTGQVNVYSGLNGTGTLLGSINLAQTAAFCNNSPYDYSCWVNQGVAFSGTAESAVFTGTANYIGFADITLGASAVPPAAVTPEPGTFMLLGTGLAGLIGCETRRRKLKSGSPALPGLPAA